MILLLVAIEGIDVKNMAEIDKAISPIRLWNCLDGVVGWKFELVPVATVIDFKVLLDF